MRISEYIKYEASLIHLNWGSLLCVEFFVELFFANICRVLSKNLCTLIVHSKDTNDMNGIKQERQHVVKKNPRINRVLSGNLQFNDSRDRAD